MIYTKYIQHLVILLFVECSLDSEGEDEVCVWGTDTQDEKNGQDKMSLTPSEGTEAGSPVHSTRAHSLSPSLDHWDEAENPSRPTLQRESESNTYSKYSRVLFIQQILS